MQHFAPADLVLTDARQHPLDFQLRALGKYRIQVGGDNAIRLEQLAKRRIRQIGMNPGQRLGGGQRALKRQMLITVQRVVMDEIQNRRLRRQHMIQVSDGVFDDLARGQRHVGRWMSGGRGHASFPTANG